MQRRKLFAAAATLSLLLVLAGFPATSAAQAKPYPERLITMIVPYGPGGSNDTMARVIAELSPKYLGQPMVVENIAGGSNGSIGTGKAAAAKPDGYTLLFAAPDNITVEPNVAKYNWDYKSFVPIVRADIMPIYLVAGPSSKASTMKELVELARANPDTVNIAVSGMASPSELAARRVFEALGGVPVQFVPFKGSSQITTAVLGGHVDMTLLPEGAIAQLIQTNKVKGLMVLSTKPTVSFPNIPGTGDLGISVLSYDQWGMVLAPAGTPASVVAVLRAKFAELMKDPLYDTRLRAAGITPAVLTSEKDLMEILDAETKSFTALIKRFNLQR
jgi:tripartite-type tricarboxylate transporter receptor subunit TctC